MSRVLTIAALLLTFAVPVAAQTKGRVSVGGSVTYIKPTDGEVGPLVGYGGLVRLNPKKGWGLAGGLSWFRADVEEPVTGQNFAKLRVRPLMGGVAYTIGEQPLLISFSVVAGPSFNDLDFDDDFLNRLPPGPQRPELDIKNSFAVGRASASRGRLHRGWLSSGLPATVSIGRTLFTAAPMERNTAISGKQTPFC